MDIEEIYREVAPRLQSYLVGNGCSYSTACDIVQETFLRLWARREELSDDLHQVSGLAFTIARNYRNDLARKARHETLGGEASVEDDESVSDGVREDIRPEEAAEESAALRRKLKASLGRMPVQLLETFALSRIGTLSVKDIASGTGASESNVKVRVHRARELFKSCFADAETVGGGEFGAVGFESAVLKASMMLAAVDGEIAKEELSLYRQVAETLRGKDASSFEDLWERSVRAMAYIGFLSEMLSPEDLVDDYVREASDGFIRFMTEEKRRMFLDALAQMASADGEYSRIERACVTALAKKWGSTNMNTRLMPVRGQSLGQRRNSTSSDAGVASHF